MRIIRVALLVLMFGGSLMGRAGSEGQVLKVLTLLEDKQGRTALSPSLFERDAYQAKLVKNPKLCSGTKILVQWKVSGSEKLKLRIELRTSDGIKMFEKEVGKSGMFGEWSEFRLGLDKEEKPIQTTAWHVTILSGDRVVAEQKSFLW